LALSRVVTLASKVTSICWFAFPSRSAKMVALERQFSDTLGRKVDLVTRDEISPYLWERIAGDVQVLYDTE
jgi:predicted nucleotidyltransferase